MTKNNKIKKGLSVPTSVIYRSQKSENSQYNQSNIWLVENNFQNRFHNFNFLSKS